MDITLKGKAGVAKKAPVTKRERWAWYMYDFGNSAYASVILMAGYSIFFKDIVVGGSDGTRLWNLSISIAMLVVAVTTPILGVVADFSRSKKLLLNLYTGMVIAFTACLFFVNKGNIATGMIFFILAEIGYRSAQVFYNSLLPEIAEPEEMGTISGNGWAIGSFGGIVALVLMIVITSLVKGVDGKHWSFVMAAVFFLLSSGPIFLWVHQRSEAHRLPKGQSYLTAPFKRLWQTFLNARHYKEFIKFIIAFLIFNMGIIVTFDNAAIIGSVLFGLTQTQLGILMITVSVASVIGAFVFGIYTDKAGGKMALVVSLVLMAIVVSGLLIVKSLMAFYVVAFAAGFALTGVQSVSRMMVSMLAPQEQVTEFYGLFAVAGSISAFIGPAVFGFMADWSTNGYVRRGMDMITAEKSGHRLAVTSILAFVLIGLALLMFVKNKRTQPVKEQA